MDNPLVLRSSATRDRVLNYPPATTTRYGDDQLRRQRWPRGQAQASSRWDPEYPARKTLRLQAHQPSRYLIFDRKVQVNIEPGWQPRLRAEACEQRLMRRTTSWLPQSG